MRTFPIRAIEFMGPGEIDRDVGTLRPGTDGDDHGRSHPYGLIIILSERSFPHIPYLNGFGSLMMYSDSMKDAP